MKAWEATVRKTQAVARKRANSLFGTVSMSHVEEEEEEEDRGRNGEAYHAEKVLPNGDYYTGQWAENFPHGQGKYLWTDGCMYVGEWHKGRTMGRGRFNWPSGAVYEGEFKSGYMDGKGSFSGPQGDTYRGQWIMNLKHGHGLKNYANGDLYEGEWRRGSQEGQGRYQWSSGNVYAGEWRNGNMNGKGTFTWADGRRYDGQWDDGVPRGAGTMNWPDGSFYTGTWSREAGEQSGTYHPEGGAAEWDPQKLYQEDLREAKVCAVEKVQVWPSQKKLAVWSSSKDGGECSRRRRQSIDGRVSVGSDKPGDRTRMWESDGDCDTLEEELMTMRLDDPKFSPSMQIRVPRIIKRQGETISKGHKNYDLMLNLQLGIRYNYAVRVYIQV